MIKILIADDQQLIREALGTLLSLQPDIELVGTCGRGDEVLNLVQETQPDVILLDIEMPGMTGIEIAAQLTECKVATRSLIVTTFGRPGYLSRALEAGASGFIVKDTPAAQLAETIRKVYAGLRVVDPALVAESFSVGACPLTDRESDVLIAAQDGASVASIARQLHLSQGTVRNHLSNAIAKVGAENRFDAARKAEANGWL
ncbi:response regulator transcription factor [Rothia sp. ZJ1223]|uniref:response regulator transcription factor n=1 Tax=Rothia sp. ZJ1223 TaxID=2811098 RepID=UPI00195D09F7|nr:response regulator transcription factor [Rothia sp. ZJ1223]MBM7051145.1 response regulator transcription factor [Rothia sp. ZJ1223]